MGCSSRYGGEPLGSVPDLQDILWGRDSGGGDDVLKISRTLGGLRKCVQRRVCSLLRKICVTEILFLESPAEGGRE